MSILGRPKVYSSSTDAVIISEYLAAGLKRKQIRQITGFSEHRYRIAAAHIASGSMQTTLKTAEIPPETAETETKTAKAEKPKPVRISKIEEHSLDLELGKVHRFLITSAQDDTLIFRPFFSNLQLYADKINARLIVGGFTYQKGLFEDHNQATASYAEEVKTHLETDRIHISEDLLFVGDANILPTTANPLNGWLTLNGGGHVVIPHARIALKSIPRMKGQPARYAVSTGCCTVPSYAPRAAGRKAIFHHTFGALLVEVDSDGETFFRHITADEHGNFQDLNVLVHDGEIYGDCRVRGVTWGDIHHEQLNAVVARSSFGVNIWSNKVVTRNNLLDWLQPEVQFFHDTLDFRRRNHHGINDPHERARISVTSNGNVEEEVRMAVSFLNACQRPWSKAVMVESNHDAALSKWLKNEEGAKDGENAYYWHRLNAAWHGAIRAANDNFNVVGHAMRLAGLDSNIEFLASGASYLLDEVECGLHGDLGINGARSAPAQYRRFGVKTSSGHTHSPEIIDGQYVAGVTANLDQGYNKGPTTWGHGHIVQYHNGKRCLLLLAADGRFMATGDLVFEEVDIVDEQQLEAA
ncbi:hypothetical protein ABIA16_003577 [Sinorhizobium fredii]